MSCCLSVLGYTHPVSSELENSGIRVAVGDCSVAERRRWRPPYQTGKTVHVHAKHYKQNGVWSGGAMALGELPVPGRPTIWMIVGQGAIALAVGAGGRLFGHF